MKKKSKKTINPQLARQKPKLRKSGLPAPRTRHQEVLCLLLEEKEPLSYVAMCDMLDNVNCHKSIQHWRDNGIVFMKKIIHRQNRFKRHGHFFKFSIKNRGVARKIYRKSVVKN